MARYLNQVEMLSRKALTDQELDYLILNSNLSDRILENVIGFNPDIDTAADEDINYAGGDFAGFLATPATVWLESADAGDTNRSMVIKGLDASGNLQEETLATDGTNGTTPVESVNTWSALHDLCGAEADQNAGNMSLKDSAGTTTYLVVPAKCNRAMNTAREIPTGYIGFVKHLYGGVFGRANDAIGVCFRKGSSTQFYLPEAFIPGDDGANNMKAVYGPYSEGTRLVVRGVNAETDNTPTTAGYTLVLIKATSLD